MEDRNQAKVVEENGGPAEGSVEEAVEETGRGRKAAAKKKKAMHVPLVPNANGQRFVELQRVVAEMRPYVLQTLRTPNFQHGKAAQNIRRALREIRTLCKHIRSETVLIAKQTPKRAYDGEMGVGLARYRQKMAAQAPVGETRDACSLEASSEGVGSVSSLQEGKKDDIAPVGQAGPVDATLL